MYSNRSFSYFAVGVISGAFMNMTSVDPFADFFKMLIVISTIIVIVLSEFSEELH